jgi:hypothetical protein
VFPQRREALSFGSDVISARRTNGQLTLRYSMNRFMNAMKCSAFLIFPGTASSSMSFDNTARSAYSHVDVAHLD